MRRAAIILPTGLALLTACGARSSLPGGDPSADGAGGEMSASSGPSGSGDCVFDPGPRVLKGRVRDFSQSHPDFESFVGDDRGIVLDHLGNDGKPIFDESDLHPSILGKEGFDQWYRDVPGVNMGNDLSLTLEPEGDSVLIIASDAFFPIDGQLLGDEGLPHNFHFTMEEHARFRYQGGEVLRFAGDDDVFVFVNDRLELDLGGVHSTEGGEIDADALGLERFAMVPLDIFFAERHTSGSTFRLEMRGFNLCE
jgi:fibro-slime domain-containing protein